MARRKFLDSFKSAARVGNIIKREKLEPARFELRPQFREVINFAIKDDPDALVLVVDGLVATRQIYDAESAHSESDGAFGVDPLIIRPPVDDCLAHSMDRRTINDRV